MLCWHRDTVFVSTHNCACTTNTANMPAHVHAGMIHIKSFGGSWPCWCRVAVVNAKQRDFHF